MYQLVIGDKEYNLPSDYTLEEWVELNKWQAIPDRLISLGMKIPLYEVDLIPDETKALAMSLVIAIMNPEWVPVNQKINNGNLIGFDSLKLGQFIDLEMYTNDYFKQMPNIVKVLYNIDNTDGIKISQVHSALQSYFKWRILLYKQYSNLFNADVDDSEADEVKTNPAHVWMDITMTLADGKFLNMDNVLEKPVIQAFNWLAWNKDRIKKENELSRRNK